VTTLNALIVDDERLARNELRRLMSGLQPETVKAIHDPRKALIDALAEPRRVLSDATTQSRRTLEDTLAQFNEEDNPPTSNPSGNQR